jgi:hypothetical protein
MKEKKEKEEKTSPKGFPVYINEESINLTCAGAQHVPSGG